mmetsp:Transcript_8679/g.24226  ORF Transcript_8679/g.24226 Transcript_8679/m.24226 type:complete len:126 (+) Transcript_8679:43-420(+)
MRYRSVHLTRSIHPEMKCLCRKMTPLVRDHGSIRKKELRHSAENASDSPLTLNPARHSLANLKCEETENAHTVAHAHSALIRLFPCSFWSEPKTSVLPCIDMSMRTQHIKLEPGARSYTGSATRS